MNSVSKVQLKLDSLYGYVIREDLKLSRQKSFKDRIDELHEDIEAEKKLLRQKQSSFYKQTTKELFAQKYIF